MTSIAGDSLLVLRNVARIFTMGEVDVPVLRGIDLEIPADRLTVILGPSGSGKTTLLNLIGGIDSPTAGDLLYAGRSITTLTEKELTQYRRECVGFVFQFYNLVPTLTALENVMVGTELVEKPMDPRRALQIVDLADRMNHFPAQLSGGEQQRVAIARALAKDPTLLLCDEPTGALDLETGRKVLGLLKKVTEELGKTVIIVTHNTAITGIADRVVRLHSGEIDYIRDAEHPLPVEEISW